MKRNCAVLRAPCFRPAARAFVAILTLAALLPGCSKGPGGASAAGREGAVPVRVATVTAKTVPIEIKTFGSVEPKATVAVKAQVGGALTEVGFKDGDEVKERQVLFMLDARPFEAALRQAQAAVKQAEAAIKQAEATLLKDEVLAANAKTEADRAEALFKDGAYTLQQRDNAQANKAALDATVTADRSAVAAGNAAKAAADAAVDNAQINLGYCTIRAPIAGRVGMRLVDQGNIVKPNDVPLAVINELRPIYVGFSVPEQQLPRVREYIAGEEKMKVLAFIPGSEGGPAEGTLTFVDNAIDVATGTIRLRGEFPNKDSRLTPGQYINVVLTLGSQSNARVIPTVAVQTGQDGRYVFVVKEDEKDKKLKTVEAKKVTLGNASGDETVIETGLEVGETVVTVGQFQLVPGSRVEVRSAPAAGEKSGG